MKSYPSGLGAAGLRFAIVVSRFNHLISARLLGGAARELEARGCASDDVHVVWVPGAFEIPLAARALAHTGRYDAIVTLGVVIRGGTPHFDYVCRAVTDGARDVMRDTGVPVAFGVLTTDDVDQALARAGGPEGNKGEEAARAAIEMARLLRAIAKPPGEESPGEKSRAKHPPGGKR
jgi:6,7-dimethyl-8-ribityllumazine synthase